MYILPSGYRHECRGSGALLARLFLPGPHAPDRAARIQALKDEILANLEIKRDATGHVVLHFESDQRVLLGKTLK